jgi:hypothetical protein
MSYRASRSERENDYNHFKRFFWKKAKNELISEFVEKIKDIIKEICDDIKESQKLARETDEPLYYEGHWVGMDAVRVDYLLSLKKEYEEILK